MSSQGSEDPGTFVLPTHDPGQQLMSCAEIVDLLDAEDVERGLSP